ncbi:MAG: hypothetical protein WAL56_18880 [Candidatus Sulfotelmatobacter sp.]
MLRASPRWATPVAAGLNRQAVFFQQMPRLAVPAVLLALVARGKVETAMHLADYLEGNDVPLINGDEENGEKIHGPRRIFFASRSNQLQAVTVTWAPVNCGLDLHAQRAGRVVHSHIVPSYAKRSGDLHPAPSGEHHEVEFCPLATRFGVL